jgi:4-amino-4-deoxy-L-arabinose transferase-like glycosyltransferase
MRTSAAGDVRFPVWLLLVTLLAAALRLWHVAAGLPDLLEEAVPYRKALEMWNGPGGTIGWNPRSFVYPSLTIYLHLFLQKMGCWAACVRGAVRTPADWYLLCLADPTSAVVAARVAHVASDTSTVALSGVIAERLRRGAGIPAALLVAFSPTLIGTSRLIFTDTVMTTFAVAALERMLAWHERGGMRRLAAAVVLIGLAAGSKYPGAAALVPLGWLLWTRAGTRGLGRWFLAALGATAVFLLTTPYALVDLPTFWRDLRFHGFHIAGGHLGQSAEAVPASYLRQLLHDLGAPGLLLLAASAPVLAFRAASQSRAIAVWLFLLAFLVPTMAARFASEHYLVPVVPASAVLIAAAALELPRRLAAARRTLVTAMLLAVLLLPVLVAGAREAAAGAGFTQVAARRWLEARLSARELVFTEPWGPRLPSLTEKVRLRGSPFFAAASPDVQQRYLSRRSFHVVVLPFTAAGRITSGLTAPSGARMELDVFPSSLDMNRIGYDPRLFAAADWIVTSGAVRGRFEAEAARFADECRFYRLLDSTATVAVRVEPHDGMTGPVITVYRIGPRAHAAFLAAGPLPPLWWAEEIPVSYRRAVTAASGTYWEGGAPLRSDGTAALWVRSLASVYQRSLQSFATDLATNLVDLDRCDAAQPLLEGTLLVTRDPTATALYHLCAVRMARRGEP